MTNMNSQSTTVDAKRFAALLAGFDTGNASEAEAMSKGRALRRIAIEYNTRIVDLLEMPEVRRAIDDQLQPARQESGELQEAIEEIGALRQELTERTRDARKLAELLAVAKHKQARSPVDAHSFGAQNRVFEVGAAVLALILMCMAVFN